MRLQSATALALVVAAELFLGSSAGAWSAKEHQLITHEAVRILDAEVFSLEASDAAIMARSSIQPDLMRPREMPLLRELEAPRHYIDLELLEGSRLPESATAYLKLLTRLAERRRGLLDDNWRLETVGTLPYALVESTQRLAAIFALLRAQPDDADLRTRALHQAGTMAHYAQDLCQPLHTTLHHDGRARRDGSSPGAGIHRQVDAMLRHISLQPVGGSSRGHQDLFASVIEELHASHAQVDRVYELEPDIRALQQDDPVSAALQEFGRQRYERAVRFTADLVHTAWLLSAKIEVPGWADP